MSTSAFDLPVSLQHKAAPALVAADEAHFSAVAATLEQTIAELAARLDAALTTPALIGRQAVERDQEVQRLGSRLRTLQRFRLDLCLGRMVPADGDVLYVGRLGLTDREGRQLLVDWRSPAAEPFFAATPARPHGLASRRRYRWVDGRVRDYWDEVLTPDAVDLDDVAPDDESAFIASLGADRSPRMRDVLATIAADQDAIIRAGSRGALVVDGGPGTGKTVVALHRAAYLLHADPRLRDRRGGALVVGPHERYLAYVSDVLPGLGEEGVRVCTLRDLVPEGSTAVAEPDPEVARLKGSVGMVRAIEEAVRFHEEPPSDPVVVSTPWDDVRLDPTDWAAAFDAAAGLPHNEARDEVWETLLSLLVDKHDRGAPEDQVRRALARDDELRTLVARTWPILEAGDVVADLWRVPAYLRRCAPWLTRDEAARLRREASAAWTVPDLPLLDAARLRLGDPEASRLRRRREAADVAERARMDLVVAELLQADDEGMFAQLRQPGLRDALVDEGAIPTADRDALAGPVAHVVVDEAQELTDAEWQMLLARCPSRSLTVVGDRAQARHGFTESWEERLARVGLDRVVRATLRINYRTPSEVMAEAEPVVRAVIPDANVPTSIRSTGVPVEHGPTSRLDAVVDVWLATHPDGIACVVGDPGYVAPARVSSLTPELVKGLEFDLVVLVEPDRLGTGIEGAVDRYVAMTRATQRLVVLTSS